MGTRWGGSYDRSVPPAAPTPEWLYDLNMTERASVETFMAGLASPARKLAEKAHAAFLAEGCSAYVKTIYIGYDFDGEMVAAMYPHAKSLEIALALDEQHDDETLVDAAHLTWRTLPVAAVISSMSMAAKQLTPLIHEACERVRSGKHDVHRDNDFFIKSRRERDRHTGPKKNR